MQTSYNFSQPEVCIIPPLTTILRFYANRGLPMYQSCGGEKFINQNLARTILGIFWCVSFSVLSRCWYLILQTFDLLKSCRPRANASANELTLCVCFTSIIKLLNLQSYMPITNQHYIKYRWLALNVVNAVLACWCEKQNIFVTLEQTGTSLLFNFRSWKEWLIHVQCAHLWNKWP